MKILVTGVAGFMGSHLAEYLANQGHEVTSRRLGLEISAQSPPDAEPRP